MNQNSNPNNNSFVGLLLTLLTLLFAGSLIEINLSELTLKI